MAEVGSVRAAEIPGRFEILVRREYTGGGVQEDWVPLVSFLARRRPVDIAGEIIYGSWEEALIAEGWTPPREFEESFERGDLVEVEVMGELKKGVVLSRLAYWPHLAYVSYELRPGAWRTATFQVHRLRRVG